MYAGASSNRIRVLIVDDSAFMRTALARMIESDPGLQVAGTAQDGADGLEKIERLNPDVVTLDIEMPRLDGLGALRRIMEQDPRPVIMISSLTQDGAQATLDALEIGAFDCIAKQLSYACLDIVKIRDELVAKVKAAAASFRTARPRPAVVCKPAQPVSAAIPHPAVIAMGSSTGGPRALQQILPLLPADLPVGLVLVQHMPPGFTGPFAKRLDALSRITVREAANEDAVTPGVALLAPAGLHMTVYRCSHTKYAVHLSSQPTGTLHTPSVDVLMLSVAEAFGPLAMGVILTGMGSDGMLGMKAIWAKGGFTVGQDEASCAVYGMPRSCADLGILKRVLPLEHIAGEIVAAARAKSITRPAGSNVCPPIPTSG